LKIGYIKALAEYGAVSRDEKVVWYVTGNGLRRLDGLLLKSPQPLEQLRLEARWQLSQFVDCGLPFFVVVWFFLSCRKGKKQKWVGTKGFYVSLPN